MKKLSQHKIATYCAGLLLTFGLVVGLIAPAYADVNDFTVTNFAADYYLSKANPQGELRVVEKIDVDFMDDNHGILRALPEAYKNLPLNIHVNQVSSTTGAPASYTTYEDNGNEVLKIGDPNQTVTGAQEYTIDYTMQHVITFYKDHDELYWNVNGTQWSQYFDQVTATLHLPTGLTFQSKSVCYAGQPNITIECTVQQQGTTLIAQASALGPGQTLTFVAAFPKGSFMPPSSWDYLSGYMLAAAQFLVPFLLLGGAGFIWWLKRGRDAKGTGVIVPQYAAPDGLSPLEAGALLDFQVNNRDLTATIIDLAIRNYLRIVEVEDKKLLVIKQKSFRLELVNKDWSKLNIWEQELMGGLFGISGENQSAELSDLATKLQTEAKSVKNLVEGSMVDRGYFTADPTKYLKLSIGVMVLIALVVIGQLPAGLGGPLLWGIIAGALVFGIFYHFMEARTAKGVAAYEALLGLKLYLNVAEKDRITMMQSPDGRYAAWVNAPEQTVDLFEKLLPYAIVLKVEKEWAEKFNSIYASPPSWYVGNYAAFNTGYLVGSLSGGFSSAMATSFSPPHSASGSGFGGGFAGGGGGGGGGGGW